jgi:hypothetical protein
MLDSPGGHTPRTRGRQYLRSCSSPGAGSTGVHELPITPFLKSRVYDPEVTKAMGVAFEKACRTLGLAPTSDPATEAVAKVIIDLAEAGERDPEQLYRHAIAHFGKES